MFIKNEMLRNTDGEGAGGGTAVQEQPNMSTTVPMHTNTEQPAEDNKGNGFVIPGEYKNKGYLKDVNSYEDVFKKLDGAQALIGQKVVFPDENTSAEDRLKFNIAAGMPEKAEGYVFEKFGDAERNVEIDNKIKALYHEAGVTGEGGKKLQKGFEQLMLDVATAQGEADDAAFGELITKTFGDRVDEVLDNGKKLIEENIPPELSEAFKGLPNDALTIISAVLDGVRTKYISEDKINDNNGGGSGNSGVEALRAKAQGLMNHPAFKDGMHQDHKKINDEINGIYAQIGKMSK